MVITNRLVCVLTAFALLALCIMPGGVNATESKTYAVTADSLTMPPDFYADYNELIAFTADGTTGDMEDLFRHWGAGATTPGPNTYESLTGFTPSNHPDWAMYSEWSGPGDNAPWVHYTDDSLDVEDDIIVNPPTFCDGVYHDVPYMSSSYGYVSQWQIRLSGTGNQTHDHDLNYYYYRLFWHFQDNTNHTIIEMYEDAPGLRSTRSRWAPDPVAPLFRAWYYDETLGGFVSSPITSLSTFTFDYGTIYDYTFQLWRKTTTSYGLKAWVDETEIISDDIPTSSQEPLISECFIPSHKLRMGFNSVGPMSIVYKAWQINATEGWRTFSPSYAGYSAAGSYTVNFRGFDGAVDVPFGEDTCVITVPEPDAEEEEEDADEEEEEEEETNATGATGTTADESDGGTECCGIPLLIILLIAAAVYMSSDKKRRSK